MKIEYHKSRNKIYKRKKENTNGNYIKYYRLSSKE